MYTDLPGGGVRIEMTRDEWEQLLICLGFAAGADPARLPHVVRLLNSINRGNPQFAPYEVPDAD
jgi:hypothetical protein